MSRQVRFGLLLLGVAVVSLMIWKAGPTEIWNGLRGSLWVVLALIPLWITIYLLNAYAWRQLTSAGGAPISILQAFRMTVIAFAVNYSTPFLSFGESRSRSWRQRRHWAAAGRSARSWRSGSSTLWSTWSGSW